MLICQKFFVSREISDKEFNSQDTTGPKSFSKFLIKLSILTPKVVIKQIVLLRKHLESDVSKKKLSSFLFLYIYIYIFIYEIFSTIFFIVLYYALWINRSNR